MVVNLEYWKAENIFQMHFRRIQSFHFWPEKSYIFFIASLSSLLLVDTGGGGKLSTSFPQQEKRVITKEMMSFQEPPCKLS